MHPSEVILMARQMRGQIPEQVPEQNYPEPAARPGVRDAITVGTLAAAGVVLGAAALAARRR
jgi:hypothetical protein